MAADPSLRHLQRDAKQEDVVTKRDSYNKDSIYIQLTYSELTAKSLQHVVTWQ